VTCSSSASRGDGFLFEERRLAVPPESLGVHGQGRGRLAIGAAKRITAFPIACLGALKLATIKVRGTRGNLYKCTPQAGNHFGGLLLRWRRRASSWP
jgi:hypothetical protein